VCSAQTKPLLPSPLPARIAQVLSWLPADTETIFVANQPFAMPGFKPNDADEPSRELSPAELIERFELLPLSLFELRDGLLQNFLIGQKVEVAMEGSRHFRRPSSLFGAMPYEGCQIAVLADASVSRRDSFLKQSSSAGVKGDSVAAQKIAVFDEKVDDEVWTIFVAFPKPNLVVACTNRDYLREVLERIGGKVGERAIRETLAEWKFVDTKAPFWGLRHYDKSQARLDPFSPFVDRNILGTADRQARGIAFRFDPRMGNGMTITYFSGTSDIIGFLKHTPLAIGDLVDSTESLPVDYRQVAPGVAEIKYELGGVLPVDVFLMVAMSCFGHGVFF
jgi:hypothetical protein